VKNLLGNLDPLPNPDTLSPLVLAYIGDAVYELYIRLALVSGEISKVKDLHYKATAVVNADFQAGFVKDLGPVLSEAEKTLVRRGRNAKSGHIPKNADMLNYRYSTGFETLVGYLYLSGQTDRLYQLLEGIRQYLDAEEMDGNEGKTD